MCASDYQISSPLELDVRESILRDRHHIANTVDDDFSTRNSSELADAQQQGSKALTGPLAAIAIVSLLVGGNGIMNIVLVSVT